jgi:glyoxylase-like metal-dependent hydrolase (beta-lactamase superfamily II)
MMNHRRIGTADVYNITEIIGPTHDPAMLYPDLPRAGFEALLPRLGAAHYAASVDRLIIGIQIWVLRLGDEVIVIDTGIGNGKPRGLLRFDRLNTLVPAWLAAAGAAPEAVTQVINTHLHGDHVGWNTLAGATGWEPSFPNARYWMPRADYAHWQPRYLAAKGIGETEAFTDAVVPLFEAGKVQFYDAGHEFAPGLTAKAAPGHTPGMMRIDLASAGAHGVFCADIFHSPLQILNSSLNSVVDGLPDLARRTRAAFVAEMADSGTLIMPCHFGAPHCGTIVSSKDGYDFHPELA